MIEPVVPPSNQNQKDQYTNLYSADIHQPLLQAPSQHHNQQINYAPPIEYMFPAKLGGYDKLLSVKGVYIKQKFRLCQGIFGCQLQNQYYVYALSDDGKAKKGSKMFKCKEESNFCLRQCCAPHCRPFKMHMNHKDYIDKNFDQEPFLKFHKPFKCTFCCFNRPEIDIEWVEGGRKNVLGSVKNPCTCCEVAVEVKDGFGANKFNIEGPCCQPGVICSGPCCQKVSLTVRNKDGMAIGSLNREFASVLKNCCQSIANFAVVFPVSASAEDRALLIASTILVDYMYFERRLLGMCPATCCCMIV